MIALGKKASGQRAASSWGRCNSKVLARNAKLHRLRRRGLLPSLTKTEQRALLARLLPSKA